VKDILLYAYADGITLRRLDPPQPPRVKHYDPDQYDQLSRDLAKLFPGSKLAVRRIT
jgi:hypothetical protein